MRARPTRGGRARFARRSALVARSRSAAAAWAAIAASAIGKRALDGPAAAPRAGRASSAPSARGGGGSAPAPWRAAFSLRRTIPFWGREKAAAAATSLDATRKEKKNRQRKRQRRCVEREKPRRGVRCNRCARGGRVVPAGRRPAPRARVWGRRKKKPIACEGCRRNGRRRRRRPPPPPPPPRRRRRRRRRRCRISPAPSSSKAKPHETKPQPTSREKRVEPAPHSDTMRRSHVALCVVVALGANGRFFFPFLGLSRQRQVEDVRTERKKGPVRRRPGAPSGVARGATGATGPCAPFGTRDGSGRGAGSARAEVPPSEGGLFPFSPLSE
jgi:hypothetical protein